MAKGAACCALQGKPSTQRRSRSRSRSRSRERHQNGRTETQTDRRARQGAGSLEQRLNGSRSGQWTHPQHRRDSTAEAAAFLQEQVRPRHSRPACMLLDADSRACSSKPLQPAMYAISISCTTQGSLMRSNCFVPAAWPPVSAASDFCACTLISCDCRAWTHSNRGPQPRPS